MQFAEHLTQAGKFKAGYYIFEQWYKGGAAWLFFCSKGQANANPKLVNNCSVRIQYFETQTL